MALTALFTGASGLQANSTALDVVGNNLANLNTTGYKTQRTLFRDQVYQLLDAGSAGNGSNVGGTNSTQLGYGVSIGSIDTQFTQGSITPTGGDLDAAIQGNGFFVVQSSSTQSFTRAGNFSFDANNFLVTATGDRVQRTGTIGDATATLPAFQTPGSTDIRFPVGVGIPGVVTANLKLGGNIDADPANVKIGDTVSSSPIQVFDSLNGMQTIKFSFTKTALNTYDLTATADTATATLPATSVTFDSQGNLAAPGTVTLSLTGFSNGAANQTITVNLGTPGAKDGLTQVASGTSGTAGSTGSTSTVQINSQDGQPAGILSTAFVDNDGILQGRTSAGRTVPLAQIAVATFNNDGGLIRSGNNNFVVGPGSGTPQIGASGTGGRGTIKSQALEGAGVDIAIEFSRLILAQRGFQVNARTISAANDTLQELANIIR